MLRFFILVFTSAVFSLCAKPLNVGMELSYPPFETLDVQGNPCGISVDIAKALGKYLNREIKIQNIPFIGLIPSLKTDKIDLILSSMTVTPEREKSIDFSDPYLSTGLCLLINIKTEGNTIEELDAKGNTIVVKLGTTGEAYALKNITKAKVMSLDREATCVLEVVQGKANAFIYDQFSILKNWQKNPQQTKANLKPFVKENWAMGIRKSDPELKELVNAFLKAFRSEGGFQQLADKYFKDEQKLFKEQGVPFVFETSAQL
ncbi:MAG: transporter substrate-binding domain-containing protein [Verrucomicrobia bacterium]|nr:transporter substrate-binding domain-containing protein [Verrucomicrobiota bacterium]